MTTDSHGQLVFQSRDGKDFAELNFKRAYRRYGPDWWKRVTAGLVRINIEHSDKPLADIEDDLKQFCDITISEPELKHVLWQLGYEVGLVSVGHGYRGHWVARAPRPAQPAQPDVQALPTRDPASAARDARYAQ
jgi:hypothetical protein